MQSTVDPQFAAGGADASVRGRIFDVQRFSVHDGPGIRTTVFLKGCTMRCAWCHNPEGLDPAPVLSFLPSRCIGCGACFRACARGGHRLEHGVHVVDRSGCVACGVCAAGCAPRALELVGREVAVGEVIAEVLRDRPFYEASHGGMTLSGGEPLMQAEFAAALLREGKRQGLNCCLETCGCVAYDRFERIAGTVDLYLFDLKETDPARHAQFTGVPGGPIIENLRRLHDTGARILLRLPIVPGCNDREDHFRAVAELAKGLANLTGVEVMPYHNLGTSKRSRMGIDGGLQHCPSAPDPATVASWVAQLTGLGVRVVNGT